MAVEEQELFGAPPGELNAVTLAINYYPDGGVGVTLLGHTTMRRDVMSLRVQSDDKGNTSNILGGLTPMLMRSSAMTVKGFRRWMWAAHNRLGRSGYEVKIERCGTEPRH